MTSEESANIKVRVKRGRVKSRTAALNTTQNFPKGKVLTSEMEKKKHSQGNVNRWPTKDHSFNEPQGK